MSISQLFIGVVLNACVILEPPPIVKVDKPITNLICNLDILGQLQEGHIFFKGVRMFHESNPSGIIIFQ